MIVVLAVFIVGGGAALFAVAFRGFGGDVCERSDYALNADVRVGDVERVKWRLDQGDDVNGVDRDFNTPLGCAIPKDQDAVVAVLLDRGADPNKPSGSPLSATTGASVTQGVSSPATSGPAPLGNSSPSGGYDELPLELALKQHNPSMVERLLEHGGDANRSTAGRERPVTFAVRAGDANLLRILLEHGAKPGPEELDVAIRQSNPMVVRQLLEHEVDANAGAPTPPLVLAAGLQTDEMFDLLIAHGADLSAPGGPSAWPVADQVLMASAASGRWSIVDRALAAGAQPDRETYQSPLLRATLAGHHDAMQALLAHGASPDRGDVDQATLVLVSPTLRSQAIQSLLPYSPMGAVVTIPGATAVTTVPSPRRSGGNGQPLRPLLSDQTAPIAVAIAQQDNESLRILLDHGADANRLSFGLYSPIYLAALDCNPDAVRLLLDHGATPSAGPLRPDGACPAVAPMLAGR